MAQLPKDLAYVLSIASRLDFSVGDFVALIDDKLNPNNEGNVLGRASDHRVGEITRIISSQCVEVRYGSETNVGAYDAKCLGHVSVTLKEGGSDTGMLGAPSEKKVGYIKSWSNFGQGDTVLVKLKQTAPANNYKASDLIFYITTNKPIYGARLDATQMSGGSKRKTMRRSRTKSFFTRFLSRV